MVLKTQTLCPLNTRHLNPLRKPCDITTRCTSNISAYWLPWALQPSPRSFPLTMLGLPISMKMGQDTWLLLRRSRSARLHLGQACVADSPQATWDRQRAEGAMDSAQYKGLDYVPCVDGLATAIAGDANNTFRCNNVCLLI